jgi:Uma2 family endonuclease
MTLQLYARNLYGAPHDGILKKTMTTAASKPPVLPPPQTLQSLVLEGVSWTFYTRTLEELGRTGQRVRITYDEGRMELMSPITDRHDFIKKSIARLMEIYSTQRNIRVNGYGSVTTRHRRLRKGVESDECYYVHTPRPKLRNKPLEIPDVPPPNLAIEVDIASGSVEREPIYAAIGVRELWRFENERVVAMHLTKKGVYKSAESSLAFPKLPMREFNRFLALALRSDQHDAINAFIEWLTQNPNT